MLSSLFTTALFALLGSASTIPQIRDAPSGGYGHGYTNSPGSPPNCPYQVPTYASNSARMYAIYKAYCDAFLYPANLQQVKAINSTLFADNIQGRVDITSTFDGAELNTEYIFGLFANIATNSDSFSLLAVPVSYEIKSFIASGDFLAASLMVNFHSSLTNITTPVLMRSNLAIDGCDKIVQYDTTFERSEWYLKKSMDDFKPIIAQKLHMPQALVTDTVLGVTLKAELAKSICSAAMQYCTGGNQIYKNEADCLLFMATLEVGATYQFGQNTLACRNLHQQMISLRPEVHCPHLSRSGGGMCIDRDYDQVTTEDYFNVPMIISQ